MSNVLAVDIGGTFTDLVLLEGETGRVQMVKTPTIPESPGDGVLTALHKAKSDLRNARAFFHGTTLGLNTLLQGQGALTGLITNEGFRDVLEIGRFNWPMYRLHWERPNPLAPRYLRKGVPGRILVDGTVEVELDEDAVRVALEELVAEKVEAVAVAFLHSYAFPAHEERVGQIIEHEFSHLAFALSNRLTREYREYERTQTAVVDALIKPRLRRYVGDLGKSLTENAFDGEFFITRSDGGVMTADETGRQSVMTLLSGPASGVMGVATWGAWIGADHLIGIDMGGTSFDAALVIDNAPVLSPLTEVAGRSILTPVVEIATIGAGGGSIAWIDSGGALCIGPQSAGASPGPICYGKGGQEPTFMDAAVVSGLLDPQRFLGGEIPLDVGAARRGVEEKIATPLGLTLDEAASGIVALTEEKMASTLEEITIGKGLDPRQFTLFAYGGGGPLVAAALGNRLEIDSIVVPVSPAAFSAWGMLTLDLVHNFVQTAVTPLVQITPRALETAYHELEKEAHSVLERDEVAPEQREFARSIDMRYEGQEHTLSVPLQPEVSHPDPAAALRDDFDRLHEKTYSYSLKSPIEVVGYRLRAIGLLAKPPRPELSDTTATQSEPISTRTARHFNSGGTHDWRIHERNALSMSERVIGPAIIEEPTATTLVPPGWVATVDTLGDLLLQRQRR